MSLLIKVKTVHNITPFMIWWPGNSSEWILYLNRPDAARVCSQSRDKTARQDGQNMIRSLSQHYRILLHIWHSLGLPGKKFTPRPEWMEDYLWDIQSVLYWSPDSLSARAPPVVEVGSGWRGHLMLAEYSLEEILKY